MYIDWRARELNIKIVYYGPAMSGKTTNLQQIHQRVDPQRRGELVSVKTHEDRTLYFDFLQIGLGKISGLAPKIHLYTVPGQTYYEASRKIVLKGADGVVFVVDSSRSRFTENHLAWRKMQDYLTDYGMNLQEIPIVIQFNKQDVADALPPLTMKMMLHMNGYPFYPAAAIKGVGVLDTLKGITRGVIQSVQSEAARVQAVR
jgi:mutual gliding-motility protein MglA